MLKTWRFSVGQRIVCGWRRRLGVGFHAEDERCFRSPIPFKCIVAQIGSMMT
jgi:hypothetical protein